MMVKVERNARVGEIFHDEILEVQKEMYNKHGLVSFSKLSNLIVKHKTLWPLLKKHITEAKKEEIKNA